MLPVLDEEDISDLSAVIKGLAQGRYPRLDAVPRALNAYNLNPEDANTKKAWAYFHSITEVPAVDERLRNPLQIVLDDGVLDDLEVPWRSIYPGQFPDIAVDERGTPSYRFVCFIHKHRINMKFSGQRAVYTISIWDREVGHEVLFKLSFYVDSIRQTPREKK
jgi:hypothetical protein